MKKSLKHWLLLVVMIATILPMQAADQFVQHKQEGFVWIANGKALPVLVDNQEDKGVLRAANDLLNDANAVTGTTPTLIYTPAGKQALVVGTINSKWIKQLIASKKIDGTELKGKTEKFIIQTIDNPFEGMEQAVVIAGSDKRGTIYGIYELSEQMGVSPWYYWADVPAQKHDIVSIKAGSYTDGEPAVRYRGIFLNDEAPCLTGWVKNTFGTNYGGHKFYEKVFELILRLKGNYLWPAMWQWSFYADDPLNSPTADEMGIIMGTSHHEPMARNHQEWARKRGEYGAWDYATNQKVIDKFFREGIERAADTEDLITIGMRGDGDTPMGGKEGQDDKFVPDYDYMIKLMKKIINNQRKIIKDVTGKPAKQRPQVWALYKEVQELYDRGLRVPDDVIMLLSDDNWGDVRRLPNAEERKHPGGWGMYYHVDYVGAPRNSKWLNVSPIQHVWEQMQLTYSYGVDKLWVLNVGDLKPMEYPITLFLDMAWNPTKFTNDNLLEHARAFCAQQFGEDQADEAMRILNLYSKYNGRITAEMLDAKTYNIENGEWKKVSDEYLKLEAEALRQYISLKPEYKDAYKQLLLFPVQAMANVYEMYYAQAMNHKLYKENNPQANYWADKVEETFKRDKELSYDFNHVMANGKWNGMMTQKHIGYTSWNDNFPADKLPEVYRIEDSTPGGYIFEPGNKVVVMEAEHYYKAEAAPATEWTTIPYLGRTLSGVALMPYTEATDNASLAYQLNLPKDVKKVNVRVVVKSTLAFHDPQGHSFAVGFGENEYKEVNFNANLNEEPENIYSIYYPTVASRVVESVVPLTIEKREEGCQTLYLKPLDPGIVFEKIIVDWGGYQKSFLFMDESPCRREK